MGSLRTLRRGLSDDAVTLMAEQRKAGLTPLPVHLMLVDDRGSREIGRTACGGGLGEWVTGEIQQVTCKPCVDQAHA